jgi:uncharacterized membrane protein
MRTKLKIWIRISMIAALYAALSLALAPYSFGPVQVRIAEALTLLPILSPWPIWSLTIGCALTNLVGAATGVNILGYWDVLWGTLATLIAAILTHQFRNITFRKIPVMSILMPILINGAIIGYELTLAFGPNTLGMFVFYALSVAAGEALSVILIGYPLLQYLRRTQLFKTEA